MPRLFAIDPGRVGGLDVLLPLALELKQEVPDLRVSLFYLDESLYEHLDRNRTLRDLAYELGRIHFFPCAPLARLLPRRLLHLVRLLLLLPGLLAALCSPRSIYLIPMEKEGLRNALLSLLNRIRGGRTYTYLTASTPLTECYRRYFTAGVSHVSEKFKARLTRINDQADGLLAFSVENVRYLAAIGCNNFNFIGFPILYESFIRRIKASAAAAIQETLPPGRSFADCRFVTVLINKFWGDWMGKDMDWAVAAFTGVVRCIRKHYPDVVVLVQTHPTLKGEQLAAFQALGRDLDAVFSHLHLSIYAEASLFVVALGQSSACMHVLPYGKVFIDYGELTPEQYAIFPEGALFADYGTVVARNLEELDALLGNLPSGEEQARIHRETLRHEKDLRLFLNYWR